MAINTAGYIKVCEYSIEDYTKRLSKEGKILKNAFKTNPSPSILSNGKVIIDEDGPSDEEQTKGTNQDKEQETENKGDSEKEPQDNDSSEDKDGGNEEFVRRNYSILEACLGMHSVFEDDTPNEGGDSTPDSEDNGKQSESGDSEKNDEENVFKPGSELYVQSLLPKEGCTIWHIQLDSRANKDAVTTAIKSKKFRSAHAIASKGLGHDGLVVLSARTYLYKQAQAPFIGQCRYAMDSGSEDTNEDADTVVIAIAPIDGRTGKPNEKTVYRAVYNMVGDITNGELEKALQKASTSSDEDDDDSREVSNKDLLKALKSLKDKDRDGSSDQVSLSDQVSKWLNSKFECVGDASMFDNFLKLRKFIEKQVAEKNLEYIKDESETPAHYAKVSEVKKSLLYY